jgi:hypothetical protein
MTLQILVARGKVQGSNGDCGNEHQNRDGLGSGYGMARRGVLPVGLIAHWFESA